MFPMKRTSVTIVALATALAGLTGCSDSDSKSVGSDKLDLAPLGLDQPAEQKVRDLYKKAIDGKQTSVVIYGPNQANYKAINESFGKRFPGIKVTAQPYTGAQLESRLATEFSSNKHVADLIESTTFNYLSKGYYQQTTPATAAKLPQDFRESTGMLWGVSGTLFGFMYNNKKVKEADAPKSWADLADPKWKGQITSGDPSQPSATSDLLIKLQAQGTINDDWLRKIAANKLAVKSELELANTAVAQGAFGISLVNIYNFYASDKKKGAPVTFVYPKDGVVIEPNYYGVVKGAPHAAAAELYLNWLFGKEAQEAFAGLGTYPLMPGTKTGSDLAEMSTLNVLKTANPTEMDKLWDAGTKKLKSILGGGSAS